MEAGVAAVKWAVVIFLAYISREAIPRLQYVVSCEFASLLSPTLSPARFPIDLCRSSLLLARLFCKLTTRTVCALA